MPIPIVVDASGEPGKKSILPSDIGRVVKLVDEKRVQEDLGRLLADLSSVVATASSQSRGLKVSEIQVGVEITVTGGINFIGLASAGATAQLILTLAPREESK